MPFPIDPPTMFLALVASTLAAVLLLLWSFCVNRSERSLLWVAFGFLMVSIANFLLAGRGSIPDWLSIQVGPALLLLGSGMPWVAVRVFNRRPAPAWVPLVGPVVWLVACQVPAFYDDFEARVVLASAVSAIYFLAAAQEIAVRDGLFTRFAISAALVLHTAFVLARIPLVLLDASGASSTFGASWFGPVALEGAIFIQVIAFLMVSLTKERVEARLRAAALTDPLTGLGNRRAFFERSKAALAHSFRNDRPLAAVLFDLDRFKEVNDQHGHPIGDLVIQTFATVATKRLRASDFVARPGGEEFAVMLPETTGAQACIVAGQLNDAFADAVTAMARPGLRCTTSAGVAERPESACSMEDLLTAADRALYEAKELGGGRVCRGPAVGETDIGATDRERAQMTTRASSLSLVDDGTVRAAAGL